jgi:hypothetical protein
MSGGTGYYRRHPGPALAPRRLAAEGAAVASYWVDLAAIGEELFAACEAAALPFEGDAVLFRFSAVELASAALHFIEDGLEDRMIRYGEPLRLDTPTMLVAGHMTVGWDGSRPLPHAHGYVAAGDGRVLGGHLSPGLCMLATDGRRIEALMTVVEGCGLVPQSDDETGFRLLSPAPRRAH